MKGHTAFNQILPILFTRVLWSVGDADSINHNATVRNAIDSFQDIHSSIFNVRKVSNRNVTPLHPVKKQCFCSQPEIAPVCLPCAEIMAPDWVGQRSWSSSPYHIQIDRRQLSECQVRTCTGKGGTWSRWHCVRDTLSTETIQISSDVLIPLFAKLTNAETTVMNAMNLVTKLSIIYTYDKLL